MKYELFKFDDAGSVQNCGCVSCQDCDCAPGTCECDSQKEEDSDQLSFLKGVS
jgi:hypothetical protein